MPTRSRARSSQPPPHPDPPADLPLRELPLCTVRPPWFRCHWEDKEPVYFGRSRGNRFDDPAQAFGVLYLGADPHCAFIETFGQATGEVVVTRTALAQRRLSVVVANRALSLVDLRGAGLPRIGADARLWAGDHSIAQRWSRALWEHPARPDGLYCPARHDPSRTSIALYDRDDIELWAHPLGGFDLLGSILDTYRLTIIDD